MKTDILLKNEFKHALDDYFFLMNNGYPEKGSLKLVGDHYHLSTDLRTILYRGISSREKAVERKQRITKTPSVTLAIDGYNVIFTLLNYRLGRFVFISNDGICRDAGSLYGKIRNVSAFNDCAALLIEYLSNYKNIATRLYLDSPVSFSTKHHELLLQMAQKKIPDMEILLVKSADESLLEDSSNVIATSDSVIIDSSNNPILDIPRTIIERIYSYSITDLSTLIR
jgi:hypothetical protein